ncbi:hypothetical protein IEQ34_018230 [Dendrobium chrysotoxum]|uniref:Uncharacterized protein n=1 Tax=Dendrobium chrysotoxum TaxID=161865 RepID=A0AAV7GCF6_DENCH|nr:hypothetical protein IEQ34_018230 [Dendrobium chrysotoxum]
MERGEPSLVPEWYRGASGNNLSPLNGSSHSVADEINTGFSTKNKLSVSFCEHDAPRSLSFTERTSSSSHKSTCSNGSMGREDLPFRAYSSFGRSHRDRNRDREEDFEVCDRNRPLLEDNGFLNNPDSLATNKLEKESLWQSHFMVSGSGDSWLKRPAHDSSNNITSGGSIVTGISKSSFERDFPMLGAEEKHLGSDVASVASPGLSNAIHNLPVAASTIIGGDGWTSALVEVPPIVGGNGPVVSSAPPSSPPLTIVSSPSSSLNMAETLSQGPARVRTSPQLPNDSQKIEELHRLQILKLRPVMPSMTKNLGLHSAEKSKTKTARTAEINASKAGQQSSSQLLIHSVPPAVRSDVYKISQPGNFQVLNRETHSLSPGKDIPKPGNVSRGPTTPATIQPPKGSMNPKLKVDGKGGALSPRKLSSQVQNRNDFFNSLRKKSSSGQQHSNANNVLNSDTSSFILEKVGVQFAVDSTPAKNKNAFYCSVENGNCSAVDCDAFEEPEKLAPDEEEEAFLRSLGWEENAGVEALTHEEIESFLSAYKMRRPASKLNI